MVAEGFSGLTQFKQYLILEKKVRFYFAGPNIKLSRKF